MTLAERMEEKGGARAIEKEIKKGIEETSPSPRLLCSIIILILGRKAL